MKILQIALAYFAGGDIFAGTTPNMEIWMELLKLELHLQVNLTGKN